MKKFIFKTLAISASVGFLGSCIEDQGYTDIVNSVNSNPVVSIYGGNTSLNMKTVGVSYSTESQDVSIFTVTSAGASVDETIVLKLDTSYVEKYNAKLEADAIAAGDTTETGVAIYEPYELLPADQYTIPSLLVTVPKGSLDVDFTIKIVNSSTISLTGKYLLPFTIASISGDPNAVIAENLKTTLISIVVKNDYEADYTVTGYFFHPSGPRSLKATKHISTIDKNTSRAGLGDLAGNNYYFSFDVESDNSMSNWTAMGSTPAAPASGFMSLDNPGGTDYSAASPDSPGSGTWVSTTYNNTYDASSKTFWMHYGYAGGGNGQNTYTRQVYEKWVRQ
jgi:hypothetical protein